MRVWTLHLLLLIGSCVFADCACSQKNEEADSPLWKAVQDKNYSLAKKMLEVGADPNAHSKYHGTPLFLAVGHDDTMMVLLLLRHSASMYDTSALLGPLGEYAIYSNALQSLEILYQHGYSLTTRDRRTGWSLIEDAVMHGSYKGVEFLLRHGASPNEADSFGTNILMEACQRGDTSIVSLLLKTGADPNKPDSKNFYPLYCAVNGLEGPLISSLKVSSRVSYMETSDSLRVPACRGAVELLLKAGANPNVEDHPGGTPLGLAINACDVSTVKLLLKYGANSSSLSSRGKYLIDNAKKNACEEVKALVR